MRRLIIQLLLRVPPVGRFARSKWRLAELLAEALAEQDRLKHDFERLRRERDAACAEEAARKIELQIAQASLNRAIAENDRLRAKLVEHLSPFALEK
jgi:hypothetical protein